jgi:hypothetical protein
MTFAPFIPTIITALVGYSLIMFNLYRGYLSDPTGKSEFIQRLEGAGYIETYKQIVEYGLTQIDKLFRGSRPFGFRGYVMCTVISFAYSVFGFLLAWCRGGPGTIGNTVLLPDQWDSKYRWIFFSVLAVTCVGLYLFTAYPVSVLHRARQQLRKIMPGPLDIRWSFALSIAAIEVLFAGVILGYLPATLLFAAIAGLGIWISSMLFFGGALIGSIAALFSGLASDGIHRFLAAVAIIAATALGASRGARPVASIVSLHYRRIMSHKGRHFPHALAILIPLLVFGLIGATGGAAFMAAGARTYAYIVGPEVDAALLATIGFSSMSWALPFAGAVAGLIGGLLATRLGQGAIVISGFISSLILILLGARILSDLKLYEYFDARSFIGSALITMLLFFVILPLINAWWDWVAWEITRVSGRKLLQDISLRSVLVQISIVMVSGFVLLIGLTYSTTFAVTFFNKSMSVHTGISPLPIDGLVAATMADPLSPEGMWITLMLFSTLLPTFFHFLAVLIGVLVVFTPRKQRLSMARRLTTGSIEANRSILLYAMYVPLFAFVCLAILGWLSLQAFLYIIGSPVSWILFNLVIWASA